MDIQLELPFDVVEVTSSMTLKEMIDFFEQKLNDKSKTLKEHYEDMTNTENLWTQN